MLRMLDHENIPIVEIGCLHLQRKIMIQVVAGPIDLPAGHCRAGRQMLEFANQTILNAKHHVRVQVLIPCYE